MTEVIIGIFVILGIAALVAWASHIAYEAGFNDGYDTRSAELFVYDQEREVR